MEIAGRTFLVTGGGSGLGAATARQLADAGGNVVVADLGRREEIGRFVETDVRDEAQRPARRWTRRSSSARCDGVVNCAGIGAATLVVGEGRTGRIRSTSSGTSSTINLVGTFNVVAPGRGGDDRQRAGAEDGERGVIVNTASIAACEGQIGQAAYTRLEGRGRLHDDRRSPATSRAAASASTRSRPAR